MFGIDDVNELRLEGSTAHKEAIHIRLACQLLAGCPRHRTPINDAGALSHCIRDVGLKPSPELFVYFLGLLRCCRLASTNGPHRLIGQDNLAPILHVICGTEITGGRVKTRKNITSGFPENESAGGLLPPGGYYRKVTLEAGVEVIGRIQDSHPPLSCISTR